jgi:hypothetical protein
MLIPTEDPDTALCLEHGEVNLDDASLDTSSPFDVKRVNVSPPGESPEYRVKILFGTDGQSVRLTPNEASNFAEALQNTVSRARDDRDPK